MLLRLTVLLCLVVSVSLAEPRGGEGAAAEISEILLIHSRGSMNNWARGLNDGFRAGLADRNVKLSVEYLDYREHGSHVYRAGLLDYLKAKYSAGEGARLRETRLAVVVPIGEYAIDFVAEYRDSLFGEVPVVFSGPMKGAGFAPFDARFERATGSINGVDYAGSVGLARRLHPDRPRLFLLFENNGEGLLQSELARDQIAGLESVDQIEILLGRDLRTADMLARIREVEDKAVVIYMSWGVDADGVVYEETYGMQRVSQELEVPLYTIALSVENPGVAGGMMVFPRIQSEATLELIRAVLDGADPDSLEPVTNIASAPVLVYDEMQRWGVPQSRWPEGAVVLNRPSTLWSDHKGAVIMASLIVFSQGVAVVCLWFLLRAKRRLVEERRRNELELSAANVALEAKNRELGENLDRAEVLTRELKIANQAKIDFLSMMSHELRTPLNPIIGYADLLAEEVKDKTQLEYLATIRNTGIHLLTLIESILDFGRASAPPRDDSKEAFQVDELLEEIAALFRAKAKGKGLGLSVDHPQIAAFSARADRHALMQILVNLVSNAVKFTEKGEIRLRWALRALEEGVGRYVFEVQDSGIGISASFRDSVFAPFTQQDPSLCRRHEGIGLGLAISKKVAENLGGSLSFESEEGHGTTFRLDVPLEILDIKPPGPSRSEGASAASTDEASADGLILIVDDHKENRSLMADALRRHGWQHVQAEDGNEAIERFRERDFAAILMDVRMPQVDGLQATQAIRQMGERGKRVPIIAMTANDRVAARDECLAAGMNDFLLKPIRLKEAIEVVKRWAQA